MLSLSWLTWGQGGRGGRGRMWMWVFLNTILQVPVLLVHWQPAGPGRPPQHAVVFCFTNEAPNPPRASCPWAALCPQDARAMRMPTSVICNTLATHSMQTPQPHRVLLVLGRPLCPRDAHAHAHRAASMICNLQYVDPPRASCPWAAPCPAGPAAPRCKSPARGMKEHTAQVERS